jgi:hypothetical protein
VALPESEHKALDPIRRQPAQGDGSVGFPKRGQELPQVPPMIVQSPFTEAPHRSRELRVRLNEVR